MCSLPPLPSPKSPPAPLCCFRVSPRVGHLSRGASSRVRQVGPFKWRTSRPRPGLASPLSLSFRCCRSGSMFNIEGGRCTCIIYGLWRGSFHSLLLFALCVCVLNGMAMTPMSERDREMTLIGLARKGRAEEGGELGSERARQRESERFLRSRSTAAE